MTAVEIHFCGWQGWPGRLQNHEGHARRIKSTFLEVCKQLFLPVGLILLDLTLYLFIHFLCWEWSPRSFHWCTSLALYFETVPKLSRNLWFSCLSFLEFWDYRFSIFWTNWRSSEHNQEARSAIVEKWHLWHVDTCIVLMTSEPNGGKTRNIFGSPDTATSLLTP